MAQSSRQKTNSTTPRVKHVPQRTCVACRRADAKRGLIRLVRDSEGHVRIDVQGKQPGRGAYLCQRRECWDMALKRRGLERALRLEQLHPDDRATLQAFAQSLPPEPNTGAAEAAPIGDL